MEGLHVGELADAVSAAPLREAPCGVQVRLTRVAVVDLGGEKLEDALRGLGRWREQRPLSHSKIDGQGMRMSPRVLVRFPDDMRPDRRVRLHASLPERR